MQSYLVGGAVRDTLLGRPVQDHDWVLVGADPQALVREGYVPVGRDFPVFLHPRSKEQYALARTERKTGPGYRGFAVHAAPDVTLEQDLARRDLTINAIAVAADQVRAEGGFDAATAALSDPFHGAADLRARVLRHVTEAFREDPVRILRVARFAARFPDFHVAPETRTLMRQMVEAGEVAALVAERVWAEIARGLTEARPTRMVQELVACGAFTAILPEWGATDVPGFDAMAKALDATDRHPDADALSVRFALFCLPVQDPRTLDAACLRLRIPTDCRDLALLRLREAAAVEGSAVLDAPGLLQLVERCDALRKPARFRQLLVACACARLQEPDWPVARRLTQVLEAALSVRTETIAAQASARGLKGPAVGDEIRRVRESAVAAVLDNAGSPRP